MNLSPKLNTAAQVEGYKKYHMDSAFVLLGVAGVSEALGSVLRFPEDSTPFVAEYGVKSKEDLQHIEPLKFSNAGRFPLFLENLERLLEAFGDEVPVDLCLTAAFTTAANLCGTEFLMRQLYQDPEFVHRILRISLDAILVFLDKAVSLDISFSIGEPTASGDLISEKMFVEYAFPYLRELISAVRVSGRRISSLHICGNTKKIWNSMVEAGADILSLDEAIDLKSAKKTIGDRAALMGNIAPTDVMLLGNPQAVDEAVKKCISDAYDNPRGYILALGCGMPKNTPPENIHAFFNAARKYGKYPLKNPYEV
jgi:uroporphyrinogen decarboxylase